MQLAELIDYRPVKLNWKTGSYSRRINIEKEYELQEWCKVFNCTEASLRKAIRKTGNSVLSVCLFLQQQK